MRAQGFPAKLRIKRRRDFLRVQRGGAKHHTRHFLVFVARRTGGDGDGLLHPRVGITVTRKIGSAVVRNRIKRLVREVFRKHRERVAPGTDIVWVAKREAAAASYADVEADLEALLRRRGIGRPRT